MIHEDIIVSGSIHHSNQITVPKYADTTLAASKTGSLIYNTTDEKFESLTKPGLYSSLNHSAIVTSYQMTYLVSRSTHL